MKRVGQLKKVYLLPNLVTTACLFSGFFAMIQSLKGNYVFAAWIIIVAGVFDMLDGRLARLTKSESDFGVEYDSLSDLTAFGVAPGILVYSWSLHNFSRFGVMVTFLYFACAALRLARYNVQVGRVEKSSFQGLPIPMAAGPIVTWVIFHSSFYGKVVEQSYLTLGMVFVLAVLMVSTIRYRSFKGLQFKSRFSFYYLVAAVGLIFVFALEPTITFFIAAILYVVSGPIEALIFVGRPSPGEVSEKGSSGGRHSRQAKLFEISKQKESSEEKK